MAYPMPVCHPGFKPACFSYVNLFTLSPVGFVPLVTFRPGTTYLKMCFILTFKLNIISPLSPHPLHCLNQLPLSISAPKDPTPITFNLLYLLLHEASPPTEDLHTDMQKW